MAVALSWDSLWAIFERAGKEEKIEIYRQLDLEYFLCGLDAEHQVEVLQNAPKAIIKIVERCLYLDARIALNPIETKSAPKPRPKEIPNKIIRMILN